ncbi:MAG: LptF/LptG family permease [Bacteroidales bacterium]|nr:LptF/LptG family permease [Bacteroidales bacterium]
MLGLKKLDWYIIKKFMLTFFSAIILIVGIVIIFDISEKIDDFVQREAPLKAIIFDYYLNFVPYFMNMFSPLFVFISVIFFTSRLTANSEFVAILSCGVSYHRMMVPYLVSAVIIAIFSLSLNLWVIPYANQTRIAFEKKYIKDRRKLNDRDVHFKLENNRFVYIESFSTWNNTAYNFTLEELGEEHLISKLSAESAQWDSTRQVWRLKNYFIRDYGEGLRDRVRTGKQLDTALSLTVEDFYRTEKTVGQLSRRNLEALIDTQEERGDANVMFAKIEMNNRWSLPFSAFILTIIGVSLSTKKRRGGIGWNIAIGIALSFSYILFMKFSEMFVYTDTLPPGIAIWLPNIIYAIIAAVLYYLAPK